MSFTDLTPSTHPQTPINVSYELTFPGPPVPTTQLLRAAVLIEGLLWLQGLVERCESAGSTGKENFYGVLSSL